MAQGNKVEWVPIASGKNEIHITVGGDSTKDPIVLTEGKEHYLDGPPPPGMTKETLTIINPDTNKPSSINQEFVPTEIEYGSVELLTTADAAAIGGGRQRDICKIIEAVPARIILYIFLDKSGLQM